MIKIKMFGKQLNVSRAYYNALLGNYNELKDLLLVSENYHAMRCIASIVSMLSSSSPTSANTRFVIDVCRFVLRDILEEKDSRAIHERITQLESSKYSTYDYDYVVKRVNVWTGETEEVTPRKFEV